MVGPIETDRICKLGKDIVPKFAVGEQDRNKGRGDFKLQLCLLRIRVVFERS